MSSPGSNQVLLLRRAFVIVGLSAGPSASVSTCCGSLVVDDGGLVWIKGSLGANMGIDARYQLPCYLRNHGLCLSLFLRQWHRTKQFHYIVVSTASGQLRRNSKGDIGEKRH